jgi:ketosteroid isomerase-like protein
MLMKRTVVAVLGVAVVMAFCACRRSGDPIQDLLKDLERAAEARKVAPFEDALAADFQTSQGMGRAEAVQLLRRYFAAYETLKVEVYDVVIERDGDTARVTLRADLDGRPLRVGPLAGFLPPEAMARFDLGLKREGERWRIATAAWEEITDATPATPEP